MGSRPWPFCALILRGILMSVSVQLDMAAAAAVMKELYDGQTVENMVYADNPFWALVPKKTNFTGKVYPSPVQYATGQGRSATFGTAQSNQTASQAVEFMIKRVKDYALYGIDHETMLASADDKGAFIEGIKFQADGAWRAIENSLATALFGSGTGSIGQIASGGITSGVITLSNPGDVVKFEVNQTIQAAATDGGTPRAALGYVIAVNSSFSGATVTVASSGLGGSAASPTSWAAGDYLLVQGDSNLKMSGLAGWLPTTAPTSGDSFFGIDRSVHPTRLAGLRYPDTGQSIEEALIDASAYTCREGGRPGHGITNPISFAALEKSLGSKVQYTDLKMGEIGFRGIAVNTPGGLVTVLSDRSCQAKQLWLLTMRTWCLKSLGAAPQILNYGDGNMLRISNLDAAEGRIGFYGNMLSTAPGFNCNVTLGA